MRRMLHIPVCMVLFSFSVLLSLPISATAEGDGAWARLLPLDTHSWLKKTCTRT